MPDPEEPTGQLDPTVAYLFKAMFEAEDVGDHDLAKQFKATIKQVLLGNMVSREQFMPEFIDMLRPNGHSPKKVWSIYQEMKSKSFSPLKLAIQLSSFISWSLQAVEKISPMAYIYLQIPKQAEMLSELMNGNLNQEQILDFYTEIIEISPLPAEDHS